MAGNKTQQTLPFFLGQHPLPHFRSSRFFYHKSRAVPQTRTRHSPCLHNISYLPFLGRPETLEKTEQFSTGACADGLPWRDVLGDQVSTQCPERGRQWPPTGSLAPSSRESFVMLVHSCPDANWHLLLVVVFVVVVVFRMTSF